MGHTHIKQAESSIKHTSLNLARALSSIHILQQFWTFLFGVREYGPEMQHRGTEASRQAVYKVSMGLTHSKQAGRQAESRISLCPPIYQYIIIICVGIWIQAPVWEHTKYVMG